MNGNNEQAQNGEQHPMSFEEAMDKLEQLVRSMESGNVKLEDMIKRFVEAKKLSAYCQAQLNSLKEKIEILTNSDPENPQYQEFHHDSEQRADFIPGSENKPNAGSRPASTAAGTRPVPAQTAEVSRPASTIRGTRPAPEPTPDTPDEPQQEENTTRRRVRPQTAVRKAPETDTGDDGFLPF